MHNIFLSESTNTSNNFVCNVKITEPEPVVKVEISPPKSETNSSSGVSSETTPNNNSANTISIHSNPGSSSSLSAPPTAETENTDSDGFVDIDTDDCSDTASVSSGTSTGSTG